MSRTIDISLVGSDTNIKVTKASGSERTLVVSLSKNGVRAESDCSNRSITVSFDTLGAAPSWDSILGKPDGKMFGGVVHPFSEAPENLNPWVYYVAFDSGHYENYGNLSLDGNSMAYLYFDGMNWTWDIEEANIVGFVSITRENNRYFDEREISLLKRNMAFIERGGIIYAKHSIDGDTLVFYSAPTFVEEEGVVTITVGTERVSLVSIEEERYEHTVSTETICTYSKDAADESFLPYEAGMALIPRGGSVGQVLSKTSDSDFETEWIDPETQPDIDNITIQDIDLICI